MSALLWRLSVFSWSYWSAVLGGLFVRLVGRSTVGWTVGPVWCGVANMKSGSAEQIDREEKCPTPPPCVRVDPNMAGRAQPSNQPRFNRSAQHDPKFGHLTPADISTATRIQHASRTQIQTTFVFSLQDSYRRIAAGGECATAIRSLDRIRRVNSISLALIIAPGYF